MEVNQLTLEHLLEVEERNEKKTNIWSADKLDILMVRKKTRQGNSVNTKYGTKTSKKYYVKKYRGQGK